MPLCANEGQNEMDVLCEGGQRKPQQHIHREEPEFITHPRNLTEKNYNSDYSDYT